MNNVSETPEVRVKFKEVLRRQGRTLTWLAKETGVSYPVATHYAQGRRRPSEAWLEKVSELLGEDVSEPE